LRSMTFKTFLVLRNPRVNIDIGPHGRPMHAQIISVGASGKNHDAQYDKKRSPDRFYMTSLESLPSLM
jgi:hypothetical protein